MNFNSQNGTLDKNKMDEKKRIIHTSSNKTKNTQK